jgi:hypothetical protein
LGITDVHAELLPGDKLALIRDLQHGQGVIAMIGDGSTTPLRWLRPRLAWRWASVVPRSHWRLPMSC